MTAVSGLSVTSRTEMIFLSVTERPVALHGLRTQSPPVATGCARGTKARPCSVASRHGHHDAGCTTGISYTHGRVCWYRTMCTYSAASGCSPSPSKCAYSAPSTPGPSTRLMSANDVRRDTS